ncbi:hypothetical protein PILCRDRAFT_823831 [Piloderma croceum F 1598]|uniref:NADP-dependent oxidoreductase domain-containing protein n=1 Tax=Piloderma croceum (strain F 1598) TaxID=765440 RepID=A0A0C3F3A2_PILCF|nr:hypothetical protein PILCRDRAFT_823831 [Piloderma croceum F 1598]
MSLPTRKIGTTPVSAIGYGAMGLSGMYSKPMPDEECLKFLDTVYASGCTFWDTADVYHDSEDIIGNWFKRTGKRNDIFLATKFGATSDPGRIINGSPAYVKESLERSLKRLGVDFVDLFYLHRPDQTVPIEYTVGAMADLVKAGKVKYLGLCECSAATLRRAHAVHPISALQVEYSPFTLDIEDEKIGLLKTARELGVIIVVYAPLGRGILTGQYKSPDDFEEHDYRRSLPRFGKENFPNILKIADAMKQIGEKHSATAGQVSLVWLLAQGNDVIPIPGTTKIKYLEENLGVIKIQLNPTDLEEVRSKAELADASQGDRYPPGFTELSFSDTPALP